MSVYVVGVQVMQRMFKKFLFSKVDAPADLLKNSAWDEEEWTKFFNTALKNYNSAKEQWNEETRFELLDALKQEVETFSISKVDHRLAT